MSQSILSPFPFHAHDTAHPLMRLFAALQAHLPEALVARLDPKYKFVHEPKPTLEQRLANAGDILDILPAIGDSGDHGYLIALKTMPNGVRKGDRSGLVALGCQVSHKGTCWPHAGSVLDGGCLEDNAQLYGTARNSTLTGNAIVRGTVEDATVAGYVAPGAMVVGHEVPAGTRVERSNDATQVTPGVARFDPGPQPALTAHQRERLDRCLPRAQQSIPNLTHSPG